MKKLIAFILIALMAISLVGCGGNNTTDPDNKNTPSQSQTGENTDNKDNQGTNQEKDMNFDDLNTENWKEFIKEATGVELPLPDDWTVTDTYASDSTDNTGELEVAFSFKSDASVDYAGYGELLFEALKTASKGRIVSNQNEDFKSFSDADAGYGAFMFLDLKDGRGLKVSYYPAGKVNLYVSMFPYTK